MINKIEKNKKMMKYAMHTNEIEGYNYTEDERNLLMAVAEEKITVKKALEIFLKKDS